MNYTNSGGGKEESTHGCDMSVAKTQPTRKEKKKTTRVQLELPVKSMERLTTLKTKAEASSYSEVIKNALRLYEAMIEEVEAGNEIFIKYKEKEVIVPYKIFF